MAELVGATAVNVWPILAFASLASALLATGCANHYRGVGCETTSIPPAIEETTITGPLTEAQVIQIAAREIARRKISLDGFRGPLVREPSTSWHSWYVFYDRGKFPGDHFSIEVDDRTGKARFWGGE